MTSKKNPARYAHYTPKDWVIWRDLKIADGTWAAAFRTLNKVDKDACGMAIAEVAVQRILEEKRVARELEELVSPPREVTVLDVY